MKRIILSTFFVALVTLLSVGQPVRQANLFDDKVYALQNLPTASENALDYQFF